MTSTADSRRRSRSARSCSRIGEVVRRLREEFPDISISKIRYLEDEGLLAPRRTQGGYRLFSEDDLERLQTILRLQRDEFLPLRVIKDELDAPGQQGAQAPPAGGARHRRGGDRRSTSSASAPAITLELAKELEEFGLLSPRGSGGDKRYPESDTDVAADVRAARALRRRAAAPAHVPHRRRPRGGAARPARRAVAARAQQRAPRAGPARPAAARRARGRAVVAALLARPARLGRAVSVDLRTMIREVPDFPTARRRLQGHDAAARRPGDAAADGRRARRLGEDEAARPRARRGGARLHARRGDRARGAASASSRPAGPASCRRRRSARATCSSTARTRSSCIPDLIPRGSKVVIHDDVLATGGTVEAISKLVAQLGGEVVGACFIIELELPRRPRAARRHRSARADHVLAADA